jgi:Spy/CpxP family protein refolding chaperone
MKRTLMSLAAVAALAGAIPAVADAAPWQSINQREANLNQRIEQGMRNGSLTRPEAMRLRADMRRLERLEGQYRHSRPGLTNSERRDLERRFDALSARVFSEKHDFQNRH